LDVRLNEIFNILNRHKEKKQKLEIFDAKMYKKMCVIVFQSLNSINQYQ